MFRTCFVGLVALAVGSVWAQTPPTSGSANRVPVPTPSVKSKIVFDASKLTGPGLFLSTNVGSFKIRRGSEDPDTGILDIHFKGTVLVSGLDGKAVPGGTARLEYVRKDHNKTLYFSSGAGSLHVEGVFDGIQFFGQNMTAHYKGSGVLQLFGEFDKDLNTGTYWYGDSPTQKHYWGTGGATVTPAPWRGPGMINPTPGDIKIKTVPSKG